MRTDPKSVKISVKLSVSFYIFGICACKSCSWNVYKIDTWFCHKILNPQFNLIYGRAQTHLVNCILIFNFCFIINTLSNRMAYYFFKLFISTRDFLLFTFMLHLFFLIIFKIHLFQLISYYFKWWQKERLYLFLHIVVILLNVTYDMIRQLTRILVLPFGFFILALLYFENKI
jgi:hypothetical protein